MLTYLILTPSPLLFHCKVSHTIQEGFDRWFFISYLQSIKNSIAFSAGR
jgi:hypothetical protein